MHIFEVSQFSFEISSYHDVFLSFFSTSFEKIIFIFSLLYLIVLAVKIWHYEYNILSYICSVTESQLGPYSEQLRF
jgi:hypothetical protein